MESKNYLLGKIPRTVRVDIRGTFPCSYTAMTGVTHVQKLVAEHFGITLKDMMGKDRSPEFSHPRMIAMYVCRAYLHLSFPAIGRHFDRDHTTVMHAVTRVLEHPNFKEIMVELNKKFGNKNGS